MQDLVDDALELLLEPEFWAWAVPVVGTGLLFVLTLVRRRNPEPGALLAMGSLTGMFCVAITDRGPEMGPWLRFVLELGCLLWVALAVTVVLPAVLPRAPWLPGRAARHLVPAGLGCVVLLVTEPRVGCAGLPLVLVALGAARDSERVDRAWFAGNVLLACHAAFGLGLASGQRLFVSGDLFLLALEGWVGAQALWGLAELAYARRAPSWPWWGVAFAALWGVGVASRVQAYPALARLSWHALGKTLPPCPSSSGRLPTTDDWIGSIDQLSEVTPLSPPLVLVLDQHERLDPALSILSGRELHLACLEGGVYQQTRELAWGAGVEVRRLDGELSLADGSPLTTPAIAQAGESCGALGRLALGQGEWTAGAVLELCDEWSCVHGQLCTWTAERGWHLQ